MRTILAVALMMALAVGLVAQISTYEALTVDATAGGVALAAATVGNTAGVPQMNYCEGRLETAQIRFMDNGTAPTTTVGTLIEIGEMWKAYSHETAKATKFIRTGATSGSLKVRCYPRPPQ